MSVSLTCPKCGAVLPANALRGLCPACLLKLGLGEASTSGQFDPALAATIDHSPAAGAGVSREQRALPEPGDRFGGYFILRVLGKGGMGAVYEADQIETGRRVALKVLKHSLDSPEARKRFLREGRLAAAINHPNSVYVFGTEEIDGTPAIAMELIAGGTLQDRVKQHGPLPVGTAVDTVLQIIAGLEAAQKAGILHRDIKPANCFIDTDGSVKIGDFGLSISTGPRGDTDLTQAGTLLGTPAFSSPEQLRGDELNLRSDIYSVGVTLYYLLTGRTPFEADNLVKLLATVLERPAPSPRTIRPDIPRPLAAAILGCLEKQPADRFRDYGELRRALLPFASTAPTPATLGLRVLASVIDGAIVWFLSISISLIQIAQWDPTTLQSLNQGWWPVAILVFTWVLWIAYYAVPEGLWGLSPGKALCRLRVVGLDRAAPGLARALARAVIILLAAYLPARIMQAAIGIHPDWLQLTLFAGQALNWATLLAVFATARRSNGYAGLHDLLTGTRVVAREAQQTRSALADSEDLPSVSTASPQIGPYHVLQTLSRNDEEEWLVGYDQRLLRRVWIRRLPADSPPVEAHLRNLGRGGRLRWLAGRRSFAENWDAYEAATGHPLVALLHQPRPWREVRFWLLDLAEELTMAERDGTVPVSLALDRIWITAEGRAKLLDFPAPGSASQVVSSAQPPAGESETTPAPQFLHQVAIAALEGRIVTAIEAESHVPTAPVPLKARAFLSSRTMLTDSQAVANTLGELVRQPAEASRGRRLAVVLGCGLPGVALAVVALLGPFIAEQVKLRDPDGSEMIFALLRLQVLQKQLAEAKRGNPSPFGTPEEIAEMMPHLEKYIARRFGKSIRDRALIRDSARLSGSSDWIRTLSEQVVAKHPQVSDAEFQKAEEFVAILEESEFLPSRFLDSTTVSITAVVLVVMWLLAVAFSSLAAALLCRGGLLLWMLGLAVVNDDGAPASRWRVLGRALLAWSPIVSFPFIAGLGLRVLEIAFPADNTWPETAAGLLLGLLYVAIVVWSVLLPGRGIPDRLASTWLVPQ